MRDTLATSRTYTGVDPRVATTTLATNETTNTLSSKIPSSVRRINDSAESTNRQPLSTILDVSAAEVGVVGSERALDVRKRQAIAGELRRIKGLRSDRVRELLPHASEEAVHRDYFVLT